MVSSYSFRTVLVALAFATAVNQAVAGSTVPHERHPAPKKATVTTKTGKVAPLIHPVATADTVTTPAAPQLVQLKGVVLNPDGRPCPGASVFPAGAPRQLVVTDAQGAFVLSVPAGTALSLRVEYFGAGSSRVAIEKPSAEPLRITLGK